MYIYLFIYLHTYLEVWFEQKYFVEIPLLTRFTMHQFIFIDENDSKKNERIKVSFFFLFFFFPNFLPWKFEINDKCFVVKMCCFMFFNSFFHVRLIFFFFLFFANVYFFDILCIANIEKRDFKLLWIKYLSKLMDNLRKKKVIFPIFFLNLILTILHEET